MNLSTAEKQIFCEVAGTTSGDENTFSIPTGAYNFRVNGKSVGRQSTDHIDIKTKQGKDAIRIADKFLSRKMFRPGECLPFLVMDMVFTTIRDCESNGYDDFEMPNKVAAMDGKTFVEGVKTWAVDAEESVDILSLTADDARYDGLINLFNYLADYQTAVD